MADNHLTVIDELMAEHKVIERVIADMSLEAKAIRKGAAVDVEYLETVAEFMFCYVDRGHHGKEEDILLLSMVPKVLPEPLEAALRMLVTDHIWARATTRALFAASQRYAGGDTDGTEHVLGPLTRLVEYYPRHFSKEEESFFPACLEQFTGHERAELLARSRAFDEMYPFHQQYAGTVQALESRRAALQAAG